MQELDFSVQQLAAKAELSRLTVNNAVNKDVRISEMTADKIARALEISFDVFSIIVVKLHYFIRWYEMIILQFYQPFAFINLNTLKKEEFSHTNCFLILKYNLFMKGYMNDSFTLLLNFQNTEFISW